MTGLQKITGKVQHYPWGGKAYIPGLLGQENTEQSPWAEYWLGSHASAPSTLAEASANITLPHHLNMHSLPGLQFLLKVLDVNDMLSIQVHPNNQQAVAGFERENAAGIALDAKNRNYKDANHKPELAVALTDFWLLHGFAKLEVINARLMRHAYLQPLLEHLQEHGLANTIALVLDANNEVIRRLHNSLQTEIAQHTWEKDQIEFWIQRWLGKNPESVNGILSLFFMNLVHLQPGQAIYQPAGLLHAYLEGKNIELMANSDNVLRAGLTPKHIDVEELLAIGTFSPSTPEDFVIQVNRNAAGETIYKTPFTEFELSKYQATSAEVFHWQSVKPEILLCIQGNATFIHATRDHQSIASGDAFFVEPGTEVHITGDNFTLFRAKNL